MCSQPPTIVIIEDEEAHFQLMKRAIGKEIPHASILYFDDASAFLRDLPRIRPDVIFVDYLMPGMNGIDILKTLKHSGNQTPVVMITGQGDEGIAVQAMKAGAWDYLVKSPDFFKLLPSTIEKTVRERKLRASLHAMERRFQDLVENTSDWIWELDAEGRYFYSNPVVEKILGYRPEEITGRPWHDLFSENVGEETLLHRLISDGMPVSGLVSRLLHRDGREVFLETNGVPVPGGMTLCISRDITDRVKAEEAIKRVGDELSTIFNSVPASIMYKDTGNNFIRINKAAAELIGMRAEEVEGRNASRIFPLDAEKYYRDDLEVINTGKPLLGVIEKMNNSRGESRWVRMDKLPICDRDGKVSGILLLAIDITELKLAEEALKEGDRLNRLLLDSLPQPAMLIKKDKTIVAANRTAQNAGAKIGGYCWRDFHKAKCIPQKIKLHMTECPGAPPPNGTRCTFCLADESMADGKPRNVPGIDVSGMQYDTWWIPIDEEIFLHYAIDVTHIRRNERALKKEKDFVESLIHTASEGIWMIDGEARITMVNRQISEMLGYEAHEMTGCSIFSFVDQTLWPQAHIHWERCKEGSSERFDFKCRRKDGSEVWAIVGTTPMFDESGQFIGALGMLADITKRKLAEEALSESEQRLRNVSSKLLTAQEEERRRIACELHDSLGSTLT
ncbi:MAG: PAS domain S-box protein, partial [Acidobacteriota bacterium]